MDTSLNEAFLKAAQEGDEQRVRELLSQQVSLNAVDKDGKTALLLAVEARQIAIVRLLLEQEGIDCLVETKQRCWSALHYAALEDEAELIDWLAEKAIDLNINSLSIDLYTPASIAAQSGSLNALKHLAERGADLEEPDLDGWNPLCYAVATGNLEMVRFLIEEQCVDAEHVTAKNETPLFIASREAQVEVVRYLLENKTLDLDFDWDTGEESGTPILAAIEARSLEIVTMLIEAGADPEIADRTGARAFPVAIRESFYDVVWYLLERQPSPELIEAGLLVAVTEGEVEVVKKLLEMKPRLNLEDEEGNPLTFCAMQIRHGNNEEILKLLVDAGVNIDSTDVFYNTVLMKLAQDKFSADFLEIVLKCNPDIEEVDQEGLTALHLAARYNRLDNMQVLIDNGAKIEANSVNDCTPLVIAAAARSLGAVKLLIREGAEVNATSLSGWTALSYAVARGEKDMVEFLLDSKADIDVRDEGDWTVLMLAANEGHKEIVSLLLKRGAEKYEVNHEGETALDLAKKKGYTEIVSLLS